MALTLQPKPGAALPLFRFAGVAGRFEVLQLAKAPAAAVVPPRFVRVHFSSHPAAESAREIRSRGEANGRNIATVNFKVLSTGVKMIHSEISDGVHSERLIHDWLELKYSGNYEVIWLYTELEPCGVDYHNCREKVRKWFPMAEIYYSIIYPSFDDVSDDDKALSAPARAKKRVEKAKRRRKRSSALLKRLQTTMSSRARKRIRLNDPISIDDFHPALNVPYSPSRKDSSKSPGVML
ncbi:nucleic acid/nucleotide deaminase domain-containing protein [Phaeospirillum tilakii]|uniref:Nucleic acid/nucleotide deaminase domain-containing protein n=1 Tax=Phaeospirillum tilakii TaxID=741673 RepID=A0ABW5C7J5_9PROT